MKRAAPACWAASHGGIVSANDYVAVQALFGETVARWRR